MSLNVIPSLRFTHHSFNLMSDNIRRGEDGLEELTRSDEWYVGCICNHKLISVEV